MQVMKLVCIVPYNIVTNVRKESVTCHVAQPCLSDRAKLLASFNDFYKSKAIMSTCFIIDLMKINA